MPCRTDCSPLRPSARSSSPTFAVLAGPFDGSPHPPSVWRDRHMADRRPTPGQWPESVLGVSVRSQCSGSAAGGPPEQERLLGLVLGHRRGPGELRPGLLIAAEPDEQVAT